MSTSIVIMVNQEMIDALRAELDSGKNYAELCIQVLIDEWGADPDSMDKEAVVEACTGHWIHCSMQEVEVTPPKRYIADCLSSYSDIGLMRRGLTRAQYNKSMHANCSAPVLEVGCAGDGAGNSGH